MMDSAQKPFTGWHMLALTLGAFGVIIAVNVFMAFKAISTFPGVEVQSSYDRSQNFDKARAAQEALGWTLAPSYDAKGRKLRLDLRGRDGAPVDVKDLSVLVGRPTETLDDQRPVMARDGDGTYVAALSLRPGKWMLQILAHARDGAPYEVRGVLQVED